MHVHLPSLVLTIHFDQEAVRVAALSADVVTALTADVVTADAVTVPSCTFTHRLVS